LSRPLCGKSLQGYTANDDSYGSEVGGLGKMLRSKKTSFPKASKVELAIEYILEYRNIKTIIIVDSRKKYEYQRN
jgi:hypothetical protein